MLPSAASSCQTFYLTGQVTIQHRAVAWHALGSCSTTRLHLQVAACSTVVPPVSSCAEPAAKLGVQMPMDGQDRCQSRIAAADGNHQDTVKRWRVDSPWACPACGNKTTTAAKLLQHMHKCCGDLLLQISAPLQHPFCQVVSSQSLQQCGSNQLQDWQHQRRQQRKQQRSQQQSQQVQYQEQESASGTIHALEQRRQQHIGHVQQLIAAAAEQEQVLRMRVLCLLYVAAPGNGVPPIVAAVPAVAGGANASEDGDSPGTDDDSTCESPSFPTTDQAAGDRGESRQRAAAGRQAALQQRQRRRGRAAAALRTPQQIADLLQLPYNRVVKLIARAPRSIRLVADPEPIQVVYEDEHFIAVCKPPGLRSAPVHRFMGGSALNRMIGYLGYEPHLLHRLDMNTSGVLVAAKDVSTAAAAHAQFRDKQVTKLYLCLAVGAPQQQQFTVSSPIGDHPHIKVARQVQQGGLPAVTHMQVLASNTSVRLQQAVTALTAAPATDGSSSSRRIIAWGPVAPAATSVSPGCCLMCCQPVTGRTHQIRVHMADAGHPLIGDEVYGLQGHWLPRQALHAWALTLQHPATGQPVTFSAPPPQDFIEAAAALGLDMPAGASAFTLD